MRRSRLGRANASRRPPPGRHARQNVLDPERPRRAGRGTERTNGAATDTVDEDGALGQAAVCGHIDDLDIAAGVFGDRHGIASRMYVRVILL